jgi:SSS family solute:Na+ symporter
LTSPWYRRLRLITMGDFFEDRYGSRRMGATYALICSLGLMMLLAPGFNAMAKTIMALTPKTVEQLSPAESQEYQRAVQMRDLESRTFTTLSPVEKETLNQLRLARPRTLFSHTNKPTLVLIVCIVVLIYGVAGGLEAAFLSDMIQGIFIIILSVILLPFAWAKINMIYGGHGAMDALRTMHERLPESTFEILGTPASIDFTWYYIASIMVMMAINVAVQPNQLTAIASAKDEYSARFGFTTGLYLKRACTLLWCMVALAAILLYSGKVDDPDKIWGYATLDLLGPLKIGLVGLMIACLIAALMSTADCLMITASSLITRNLYRHIIADKDEKHYVLIGRIAGAGVVLGAGWMALQFESVFGLLKLSWEIFAVFAAVFWLGMKWRRANRKAAWASIAFTFAAFFLLPTLIPLVMGGLKTNVHLTKMTNPTPMERFYVARTMDVTQREDEIKKWTALSQEGKAGGQCPVSIQEGKRFSKVFQLPDKSIFWQRGVTVNESGQRVGRGMLNLELLLVDSAGWDLSKNPYALNETIRVLFRTIIPFLILFIVGCITKPDEKEQLDRFFVKMKTKVVSDRVIDEKELALSYAQPDRYDNTKLFPVSNWEFDKWNKEDAIGFLLSCLVACGIVGTLFVIVSLGS